MSTDEEEEDFAYLATEEEQDNFVRLCGAGDLESVTQLLADDPSLIKARRIDLPCNFKNLL